MLIKSLHNEFGAQVTGVDLSIPLSPEDQHGIDDAINRYSVLLFRDQSLDEDQQKLFSENFGSLEEDHVSYYSSGKIGYVGRIGNIQPDGSQLNNTSRKTVSQTANNLWHSDSSFREIPSLYSLLVAHEVPTTGGDTEFVSARSAYARLSDKLQSTINNKIAIHDYIYSRTSVSEDAVSEGQRTYMRPVRQRLVRTNPLTGDHNYYVGSHVRSIEGMDDSVARPLIDQLMGEATRSESIYRHIWQPGDVVMWDNRCVLHRGCGYDADLYRRLLLQTRVRGIGPSLAEEGIPL